MQKYLIYGVAIMVIAGSSYWAGGRIATEECRANTAIRTGNAIIQKISENNEKQRRIHVETVNTHLSVIRDILRTKYTIAD